MVFTCFVYALLLYEKLYLTLRFRTAKITQRDYSTTRVGAEMFAVRESPYCPPGDLYRQLVLVLGHLGGWISCAHGRTRRDTSCTAAQRAAARVPRDG
jgi:hypothetical protein